VAASVGTENHDTAHEAIVRAGTNALPFLLRWIGTDLPTRKLKVAEAAHKYLPVPIAIRVENPLLTAERSQAALCEGSMCAFAALGEKASPAIPILLRMTTMKGHGGRAMYAIGIIGPPAIPTMLNIIRDPSCANRDSAIAGVVTIRGAEASQLVPTLRACLQDADEDVRTAATNALLRVAPEELPRADSGTQ
jgi:hypothetical protein